MADTETHHRDRLTGITDGQAWSKCSCGFTVTKQISGKPFAGLHAMSAVEADVAQHQQDTDDQEDDD